MNQSYKKTITACYLGTITQAVIINLTSILFIPLRVQFGLTYTQLGSLVLINFITQVLTDILISPLVDRFGFRIFVSGAHIIAVAGLTLFALTPVLPVAPYAGLVTATILFSIAGGLLELILSPIMNAIPSDEKAAAPPKKKKQQTKATGCCFFY